MWYADPFLVFPATFAQAALISFVIMIATANLKLKATSVIASIFACCFTFVSAFSYFFGYCLRHSEEVSKWIGTMLQ